MTLNIDVNNRLKLYTEDFIGKSVAILGSTGTGKTNTVAVLMEEIGNTVPMTIVDIEGEYWGLREQLDILVVGKSPNVDIVVLPEASDIVARFSHQHNISIILDLLEYTKDEQLTFIDNYLHALWRAAIKYPKPYQIVLEEAHEWIPQRASAPLKDIVTRIALRGRKRGLGMFLASQRPAKVDKDVLTQARMLFLHKVFYPTDIKTYQDILPMGRKDSDEMIGNLSTGQIIFLQNYEASIHQIRLRETFHAGATPDIDMQQSQPDVKSANEDILKALRDAIADEIQDEDDAVDVVFLRAQLKKAKDENKRLKEYYEDRLEELEDQLQKSDSSVTQKLSDWKQSSIERQHIRLDRLIRKIQALPRFHIDILTYLIEHDGHKFNTEELAQAMGLSYASVSGSPPLKLIEMGLIERSGRPFQYYSVVGNFIEQNFGDLDHDDFLNKLFAATSLETT